MTWGVDGGVVRFGATVALDGVTLAVPAGRVVCVIGGDGAGKSSLLRVMVGTLPLDHGRVERPDRRRSGYMPATSGLYSDLSVRDNLEFRGSAYGLRPQQISERSVDLLERTGLAHFADRPVGNLSGGMRQKLGVVCAMLSRPDLLVLDEPTTGVDPVSRADLWWLIASCVADGAAVLVSTTYVHEAQRCGHVALLEAGRILASGTPAEVIAATPGRVTTLDGRPDRADQARSWRRGSTWRVWEDTSPRAGAAAAIDLQDSVIVAELAAELDRSGPPARGAHGSAD